MGWTGTPITSTATTFTTWSALKTAVLDALANGSILTQSYSINGRDITFRSLDEVKEFIQFCDLQIMGAGGLEMRENFVRFGRPS